MRGIRMVGRGLLAIVIVLGATLGTMRLGWWNPSYDTVKQRQATASFRARRLLLPAAII